MDMNRFIIQETVDFSHNDASSASQGDRDFGQQVVGAHRFTPKDKKDRPDPAKRIQGKLNALRGTASRKIAHRKWAKSSRGKSLLRDLHKYNEENNDNKTEESVAVYFWRREPDGSVSYSPTASSHVMERWLGSSSQSGVVLETTERFYVVSQSPSFEGFADALSLDEAQWVQAGVDIPGAVYESCLLTAVQGFVRSGDCSWFRPVGESSRWVFAADRLRRVIVSDASVEPIVPHLGESSHLELMHPVSMFYKSSDLSFVGTAAVGKRGAACSVFEDKEGRTVFRYSRPLLTSAGKVYASVVSGEGPVSAMDEAVSVSRGRKVLRVRLSEHFGSYTGNASQEDTGPQEEMETVDDRLDRVIASLVVNHGLDFIQDVNFDDNGSVLLFINPVVPENTVEEIIMTLSTDYEGTGVLDVPDVAAEYSSGDWWVVFVPAYPDAPLGKLVDEWSVSDTISDPRFGEVVSGIIGDIDVGSMIGSIFGE